MILWRTGRRYLLRHPLQVLFAVIGVALGVAIVTAIDLANASAEKAFRLSAEALSGGASHHVVGGPSGLDEQTYAALRLSGKIRDCAPVVEGYAAVAAAERLTLKILGVDPFAEPPFRSYAPEVATRSGLTRLLTEPGTAFVSAGAARRLKLEIGQSLDLIVGGREKSLTLAGLLEPGDEVSAQALESLVITDIATAQELLGRIGRLSRIDLVIAEGRAGESQLKWLRSFLPAGAEVIHADSRGRVMAQMTRAFSLNLTALSLLALMVGMFLIYNTMTFSVLQRRPLLGILRTLGVTRGEIFLLVMAEALLVGLAGTALGLLLGIVLGSSLLQLVTRTINDLYFVLEVSRLALSPLALGKGIALGLGATALAALVPAREAASAPPRTVLSRAAVESRTRRRLPLTVAAGTALVAVGSLALLVPSKSIPWSFALLFVIIAGYALLTPGAAVLLVALLQRPLRRIFGTLGKMAARDLVASLSRTGVATAALVIAVAATVGVGIMIGSFRLTVVQWLENYLRADIYLASADPGFGPGRTPLNPQLIERLASLDGIERITRARHLDLESDRGRTELFVAQIPKESFAGYRFSTGDREAIWRAFQQSQAVLVSEPYAFRHDLGPGDRLDLRTDRGVQSFTIAGVYTDYGSDQGRVTISRQLYLQFWDDHEVDALGLYLAPGFDAETAAAEVRRQAAAIQQVEVYSNRSLREASIATFDRTFAITAVLRMLAVLVAFVGILNALMAMQIERGRELAVLRATGLTPRQLWGLVSGETALIGLVAGILAIPLGIGQALVLILVINRRSFGWTMQTWVDPALLFQAVALALAAALLAGVYPAWKMARTSPALALRQE